MSQESIIDLAKINPPTFAGVQQSPQMLEWLWENFSAVAGDQPSFECWPSRESYMIHEVLLSGWGCPIGELFDLEKLGEQCKRFGRWSFFVTSEVCNVRCFLLFRRGGTAAPSVQRRSNCLEIESAVNFEIFQFEKFLAV